MPDNICTYDQDLAHKKLFYIYLYLILVAICMTTLGEHSVPPEETGGLFCRLQLTCLFYVISKQADFSKLLTEVWQIINVNYKQNWTQNNSLRYTT